MTTEELESRMRNVLDWLLAVGLLCSGALMVLLFVAGFHVFWVAAPTFFQSPRGPSGVDGAVPPLVYALKGLEYLFLAPLAFLVFQSLIEYITAFRKAASVTLAERQLHRTKALIVSLMVAVIATDLVGKILGAQGLELKAAATEVLVMTALVSYILVLERQRSNVVPESTHRDSGN